MSITNFTRGPWFRTNMVVNNSFVKIETQENGGDEIARVRMRSDERGGHNAYLIAAAPELYTVLDAFLSDYEERGEVDYKLRQRAQAVLDKAVGR